MLAMKTVKPLMTIMNRPRDSTIAGNENMTIIGFNTTLIIASISPAIIITFSLLSYVILLLKKLAAIQSPKLQTTQRVKKRYCGLFMNVSISAIVD